MHTTRIHIGTAAVALAAVLALAADGPTVSAQARGQGRSGIVNPGQAVQVATDSYPLAMTADRAHAFLEAYDRHLDYLPGEVLVKFKDGTDVAGRQRALMALRSHPSVDALQWIEGATGLAMLRDRTQPDARILAEQLSEQTEVEFAAPNYIRHPDVRPERRVAPLATGPGHRGLLAALNRAPSDTDYGTYQWNFSLLNLPGAWDINPGAHDTLTVASIDTGVTTARQNVTFRFMTSTGFQNVSIPFDRSPDLDAARLVSPRDFIFAAGGGPVLDMVGHGTHTASTIAETTDDGVNGNSSPLALAGIAYNVKIMPVKVCIGYWEILFILGQSSDPTPVPPDAGGCTDDAIIAGIDYAANNGAKVINLSLGGPGGNTAIQSALTRAVGMGVFVTASMGNGYEQGNLTNYPAGWAPSINGMMSVGAIGKQQTRAYYSNTGNYCEIAAPGGDNRDASAGAPDFGFVWQVTLYYPDQDPSLNVPRFDRYAEIGYIGTSMAAPHVAGLAALLMDQGVTSPAAVEQLIRKTARDLGATGKDDQYGDGLIQPRPALFGWGIAK